MITSSVNIYTFRKLEKNGASLEVAFTKNFECLGYWAVLMELTLTSSDLQNMKRGILTEKDITLYAQIVCDSDVNILSVDASHGGADHDSFIWNHHILKSHLEELHQAENETVWFVGDSGYPLRSTLMTPIVDTEPDTPQRDYTELHCRVRNTGERTIGVLKLRWRCLLVDRKLHYHPTMAGFITNACIPNTLNATASRRNHQLAAGETMRDGLVHRLWSTR